MDNLRPAISLTNDGRTSGRSTGNRAWAFVLNSKALVVEYFRLLKRTPLKPNGPGSARGLVRPAPQASFRFTFLVYVNSRSSAKHSSRPMPDCFTPPKGAPMKCWLELLIHT